MQYKQHYSTVKSNIPQKRQSTKYLPLSKPKFLHLYINSVNAMTTDDRKLCMVAKYFPARPQSGISVHTCMSINVIEK